MTTITNPTLLSKIRHVLREFTRGQAAIFRYVVDFPGDHERCGAGGVGQLRAW